MKNDQKEKNCLNSQSSVQTLCSLIQMQQPGQSYSRCQGE